MVYYGSIVGAGLTLEGLPAIVCGFSGISERERGKKAYIDGGSVLMRPHDENAGRAYPVVISDSGLCIASNGKHIEDISERCRDCGPYESLESALETLGCKHDRQHTPRIAGIANAGDGYECFLGTAAYHGTKVVKAETHIGLIPCVTTHSRKNPWKENSTPAYTMSIFSLRSSHSARGMADMLYYWMDKNYAMCTAAAVYNPEEGRWDLAVRNLHE